MKTRIAPVLIALVSILLSSNEAGAAINVQTFNPSTSDRFVLLEDALRSDWPKTARFSLGLNYNLVTEPLVVMNAEQTAKLYNIIDTLHTVDAFFGIRLSSIFGLYAALPIHYVSFSGQGPNPLYAGSATSAGDLKIMGKMRLTEDGSNTSIALIPELHLPTGNGDYLLSDSSAYIALRGSLERVFESWTMILNLGYASASGAVQPAGTEFTADIDYRKRLIAGIGGYLPFNDNWGMNFELNSINMIPFDRNVAPNDAYLGFRYGDQDGFAVTAGASVGRIGGAQGQQFRFITGLRYTLFEANDPAPRPLSQPIAAPAPTAPVVAPANTTASKPSNLNVPLSPAPVVQKKPETAPAAPAKPAAKATPTPTPAPVKKTAQKKAPAKKAPAKAKPSKKKPAKAKPSPTPA